MLKFQRNYRIEFERGRRNGSEYIPEEIIEVKYPISLNLDVQRSVFSTANTGAFQLYNLSPETQAKLWKDKYDQSRYVTMKLYAGYQDIMPLIFKGDFLQCYSYRQSGSTDFITEIEANDMTALYESGFAAYTFQKGTSAQNLLKTLLNDVPTVDIGYISPKIQSLRSNQTFLGQTIDLLRQEFSGYTVFVDNGLLNILDENEVIDGQIQVITAETGLLGTPRRADAYLQADMIFEPSLIIGQALTILSDTIPFLNNTYKLVGLRHSGLISPVSCERLITTATFSLGDALFEQIKRTVATYGKEPSKGNWLKPVIGGRITSSFGGRTSPTAGASSYHKGIDIGVSYGTPIIAPASGTVTFVGQQSGYGNCINIEHGGGVMSVYGHLSRMVCMTNQQVSAGTTIGYVGSTGISTGPHLHFEVRENGHPVNPLKYIGTW